MSVRTVAEIVRFSRDAIASTRDLIDGDSRKVVPLSIRPRLRPLIHLRPASGQTRPPRPEYRRGGRGPSARGWARCPGKGVAYSLVVILYVEGVAGGV